MLLYKVYHIILSFIFLFLAEEVNSQRIRFVEDDGYPRRTSNRQEPPSSSRVCDSDSYCVRIRNCAILRNRRDWRTVGQTCEFGYGEYRSVCCPRRTPPRRRDQSNRPRATDSRPRATEVRPSPRIATPATPEIAAAPSFSNVITNYVECGQSRTDNVVRPFVMGGQNATEGAWPWMVAIVIRESSGIYAPWCTGFLIDRKHVVSAAHCFDRRGDGLYSTRIGRINQNEAQEYSISRITVPETYTRGMYYDDIAILTLSRDVDFPNFNPICLPDEQIIRKDLTDRGTTVAGWGADRPNGQLKIFLQQLSRIPVVSNQRCNRILRETLGNLFRRQFPRGINNAFICAGFDEGEKDACGGDSGGPLMYQERNRWFVVGIVSFGYSCGRPGIPGGYTRIANHLDWIRQNTRD